jgi:SPP1 family predicted phage head-tail adaptor
MGINAGRLDQRITIQRREEPRTINARGEDVSPWVDVATVWASADPKRGAEFMSAQQLQAEGPVLFRIRWRTGVTEKMRVLWRGVPYAIVSPPIDAYGMKESLDLYGATGLRDGD